MGRKRDKTGKTVPDIVVKGRNFPLFPLSFQHSTPILHSRCGKRQMFPRFNIPSTVPQQTRGKPKPRIPARVCGVFHIFPSPYYDYYNKFNIENRFLHRIPWETTAKLTQKRRDKALNIICDKTLLSAAIDGVSKAVTLRSTIPVSVSYTHLALPTILRV